MTKIIYTIATLEYKTTFLLCFFSRFFLNYNTKYVILYESKGKSLVYD